MKHTTPIIALCLLLALALPAFSQQPLPQPAPPQAEIGMPLLRNYTPKEYGGAPQVWSLQQDRRGVLYFGKTGNALLEYDGVTWRKIRIRDNGMGIPAEVREKLFHPFFTTKPTGQGTGLGLSISHDIVVQQHRGQLEVETEPGEFTEFIVRLPRRA